MPRPVSRPPSFPRAPLLGAAGLVSFAILAACVGRLSGPEIDQPVGPPVAQRDLRFADRADGAVLVYDTDQPGLPPVAVETGENGFLRGTLRGFARARHAAGIGADAPFELTAYADGRLTLVDPSTGRHTDLEAFGSTNVLVFARFLTPKLQSAANTSSPASATP